MISLVITFCALWVSLQASGCANTATERVVVPAAISACPGTIASGGLYGADAQALCGTGYHVCSSAIEAIGLGLTEALCDGIAQTSYEYFATQETSTGFGKCYSRFPAQDDGDKNDVWGCGGSSYNSGSYPCLGVDYWLGGGNKNDWIIDTSASRWSEMEATLYRLTDARSGGVLCCAADPCAAAGLTAQPQHRCSCQASCSGEFCRAIGDVQAAIGGFGGSCSTGVCCCSCADCVPFNGYV